MKTEIKIIRSEKSWIESSAIEQLKKVGELKGVVQAVGMPDLHPGKTPVGAEDKMIKVIASLTPLITYKV